MGHGYRRGNWQWVMGTGGGTGNGSWVQEGVVLEWTLGLPTPGSIFSAAASGNMGDSGPPGILCESCACIIHTNLQSCMSIISETLHDQSFSHI